MNAYPAELIQHHYACMLVSGLLSTQGPIATPDASKTKALSTDAANGLPNVENADSIAATKDVSSSAASTSAQPQSRSSTPSQAFPQITKELCEIFSSRGRQTAWDPSKAQSAVFHTVLVDNNVRLPPRKTRPTPRTLNATGPEQHPFLASLQPRSPLSPLHPSSPLFPDGLIAPIWLRKHRELVPSIFVSFYCLAEQAAGPLRVEGAEASLPNGQSIQATSGAELKKLDEDLIRVISERKRALGERGIKFTVVLLTSREMLESPTLESRLSYIRRSSQLDSKASLFVLTPVTRSELGEFVTSLQSALYEPAQDYYREHYRRAKRKRSRYPPNNVMVTQIMTAASEMRGSPVKDSPLSKEGWLTRNDYKMGTFAELSSNLPEALQHYNVTYQSLVNGLLASTMLLPPRTKRWAEAKVLSDCLNLRICKLHLYRNDGDAAWEHFKNHVKRFTELSQGWGIGEMTFEYWSWLGKQYRLMGDLLDLATKDVPGLPLNTFRVPTHFPALPTFLLHPSHLPTPTANGQFPPSHNLQHGNLAIPNEAALAVSIVPVDMCQGAGACFYIAGICAMERWHRYRKILKEEEESSDAKKEDGTWSTLTQEKKIDHASQAIEVFTRAHEVYKRFQMQRQSLLVASKIAIAYVEGEQYEMALRFLERIAKSLASEGWYAQAQSLQLLSYQCSEITHNTESKGRALWSLLSICNPLPKTQRIAVLEELQIWMKSSEEKVDEAKRIHIESSGSDGCLFVETTFAKEKIELNEEGVLFQLCISSPNHLSLNQIQFDSLQIYFNGNTEAYTVAHKAGVSGEDSSMTMLSDIDLTNAPEEKSIGHADLRWWSQDGTRRVFQGRVIPSHLGTLQIERVRLKGKGARSFSLDFNLERPLEDDEGEQVDPCFMQPKWITAVPLQYIYLPCRPDRDGVLVQRRSHKVQLEIKHGEAAYLDEGFKISLIIRNNEGCDVQCYIEASIGSEVGEMSTDDIRLQDAAPPSSSGQSKITETSIGLIEPGTSIEQSIVVHCRQSLRTRSIEIVLRTSLSSDSDSPGGQSSEIVETIEIPVKALFAPSFYGSWRTIKESTLLASTLLAARKPSITVSDVDEEIEGSEGSSEITISTSLDGDVTSIGIISSINVALTVLAKEQIVIHSVHLLLDEGSRHLRLANEEDAVKTMRTVGDCWTSGDRWGTVFDVEVLSEKATGFTIEGEDGSLRPTGKLQVNWQREKEASEAIFHTAVMDIPLLLPPMLLSRIVLSVPISTTLDQPLIMLLSIVNPARLPAEIFIAIDDSQSDFGILSHKTFTVPLIAKSSRSIPVHVLGKSSKPKGITSAIRLLPKMRAWQRDRRGRKEEGETDAQHISSTSNIPIMNQQKGGGLPLEVQLRYSRAGQTSASGTNHMNGSASTAIAQLQAESQKSGGSYTIFTYSSTENILNDAKVTPFLQS